LQLLQISGIVDADSGGILFGAAATVSSSVQIDLRQGRAPAPVSLYRVVQLFSIDKLANDIYLEQYERCGGKPQSGERAPDLWRNMPVVQAAVRAIRWAGLFSQLGAALTAARAQAQSRNAEHARASPPRRRVAIDRGRRG